MNSTGTITRRPDRVGGPGSDTSRPRNGHQRLIRGEKNRPALVGDRHRAKRFFAHRQLERRRQIIQEDQLLVVDDVERQRAAAFLGENRERRRCRTLAAGGNDERQQPGRDGDGRDRAER